MTDALSLHMILDADVPALLTGPAHARRDAVLRAYRTIPGISLAERVAFHVPGRLEVLGKHTDYAGGRSLLCAVERGFVVVAGPRRDGQVVAMDAACGERVRVRLPHVGRGAGDLQAPGARARLERATSAEAADGASGALGAAQASWGHYVETAVRRLSRNFGPRVGGATIVFASDLPRAAGLSSSSALVVSCSVALLVASGLGEDPALRSHVRTVEDLATYVSCIENGQDFGALAGDAGVGTRGGSEDHVAMLCAVPGALSAYAFAPVRLARVVPLAKHWTFAVAVSGVVAEKTGAARDAYNRAALAAARVLDIWNAATGRTDPTLGAAVASSDDAPDRLRVALDAAAGPAARATLQARLEQFLLESTHLIPAAIDLLAAGRVEAIGPLVDRSQRAAEALLGNQVPETVALARGARRLGAVAASAFGAGFGGSVWALLPASDAEAFLGRWRDEYVAEFPARAGAATFFSTRPGPPAARIGID